MERRQVGSVSGCHVETAVEDAQGNVRASVGGGFTP